MIAFIFALCLGMNQYWLNSTELALNLLQPECWYNWTYKPEENFQHPGFNPMLWKVNNRNLLEAGELAIKYPGRTWFIYNEPEGQDQANTTPEIAADWFDKAYTIIKNNDPSALVGCCGVMLRQSGFDWMDKFKPVNKPDFYHIHIYATNKKDWQAFVDYWHWWNVENVPTYITETCGVISNNQADLLKYVANYNHPNIKQIYWFGAYQQDGWNCGLIDDEKLNNLGNIYTQPLRLTPTIEPATPTAAPTVTPQTTPIPTITLQPFKTVTPTLTPTSTQDPTGEIGGEEPTPLPDVVIIMIYQTHFPIAFN